MGKRKAKKILSACLALTFLLTVRAEGRTIALPESDRDTMETAQSSPDVADETVTLMVYMVGSTLESQTYGAAEGAASRDIREIIASGVDTSRVNVLVFTGGASRWTSNVSGEHNSVYLLEEAGLHDIYDTDYNWDMGEADTLAEFLRYGYNEFPADHYALILWDHGGGPLGGFGLDENYVNEYGEADRLYPEELREALERSPFGGSVRFDWVGYDACLMDSIETAVLWADYADYLIASEESESGDGWDYSFLSVLNETVDPARIGTAAADSFADFYEKNKTWYFNPDYTLSCLDLSKVSDVTDCLDALFAEMARDVSGSVDSYKDFAEIRNKATCFSPDERCDLVDLGDLAARTAALYPELAGDLSDSVAELVVCNRANMEGAGGVSIYYPYDNKELYESYADYYATLGMPYGYLEYLAAFSDHWAQEGTYLALETDAEELSDENEVVIQLTEEQLATLSDATYTVMIDSSAILGETDGTGLYTPVMVDQSIEPDENGQLHIPKSAELLFMRDTKATPWIAQQVAETDRYVDYITPDTYLGGAAVFSYDDKLPAQLRIRVYRESGKAEIVDVNPTGGDWSEGRTTLSLTDFNLIGRTVTGYVGEDYVPYTDWEESSLSKNLFVDFSSRFQITPGTSDTVVYPVVCQVLLEDVSGEVSASKLIDLNWNERETVTAATENGEMTFVDLDGSLMLDSYSGTDTELDIPARIDGIPVTGIGQKVFRQNDLLQRVTIPGTVSEIGWEAFYRCANLESVVLEEGLERISEGAFANCGNLTAIDIPASVSEIGLAAFAGCDHLTGLTVSEDNPNYRMQDGFVLSSDGTELVSYTAAAGDPTAPVEEDIVRIPDGVEEIADGAFAYCVADQILLPEGLLSIGNYAFYMCLWMEAPEFPDSLESIGSCAFNMGYYGRAYDNSPEVFYNESREDLALPDPMPVSIGPNLLYISGTAFSDDIYSAFLVDPDNPYYSSVEGDLANKAGDYIICRAYRGEDPAAEIARTQYMGIEFDVPDGFAYEAEEDGAYFTCYADGEPSEEMLITASDPDPENSLTGTDRDFALLKACFRSFAEEFDDVSFTENEIEIAGCAALYYTGTVFLGTESLEYDLAAVANPYDQCIYLIARAYEAENAHRSESEFRQFLGSITWDGLSGVEY